MERIKNLNGYQKALIIIMIVAVMVFSIIYPKTISRVGFKYCNKIFVPTESDDGSIIYSGKIDGTKARFVVSPDKVIEYHYGETVYGPYTVIYDPTAVPKDQNNSLSMIGKEVREGDKIMFRGGVSYIGDFVYLYDQEPVKTDRFGISLNLGGPPVYKNIADSVKPNVHTILALTGEPELTHNGSRFRWFMGTMLCLLNAVTMIFADELFRFDMSFEVSDPDGVEPSDWRIMSRYIAWTFCTIMSVALFIYGLQ